MPFALLTLLSTEFRRRALHFLSDEGESETAKTLLSFRFVSRQEYIMLRAIGTLRTAPDSRSSVAPGKIHGYLIILSLSLSLSLSAWIWENLSIRSESSSFVGGTKDHCNTAGCCAGTHSQPIRTNDFISAKRIDIFLQYIYIAISFLGHLFIIYSDGASSATGQRSTFTVSNCKFFSPPEIEISRGEQDFFIFTV
jgi:hypothetical protein